MAMFRLAEQLSGPVVLTTTTHLGIEQTRLASRHYVVTDHEALAEFLPALTDPAIKTTLITGPQTEDGRVGGIGRDILESLRAWCNRNQRHLLVEADGSRGLPLKAPAAHEPAIPPWIENVVVLAGMQGLDHPLGPETVHRPERFGGLAGISEGDTVTADALARVLLASQGGLKNIPVNAGKYCLLNQADSPELQAQAGKIAAKLIGQFRVAMVGSLSNAGNEIQACFKPVAGIILAAGGSTRYGQSKPLLEWNGKPFVRHVAQTALDGGLAPVIVITGYEGEAVSRAVAGMNVKCIHNSEWSGGQAGSVKLGIRSLPELTGGAIFFLADQPQVKSTLIQAELELSRQSLAPVIAPMVDGRRTNPVLFDRVTFSAFDSISGDAGGRQLFSQFPVKWLEWSDTNLLLDVDTPDDYQKLLAIQ